MLMMYSICDCEIHTMLHHVLTMWGLAWSPVWQMCDACGRWVPWVGQLTSKTVARFGKPLVCNVAAAAAAAAAAVLS
jgi:hypothetical protein